MVRVRLGLELGASQEDKARAKQEDEGRPAAAPPPQGREGYR